MPTTTNYIYDEQNYLAESDATNTISVVYTNEPRQYGNLISSRISGTTSYHEFDALGSTRQLTSSAGNTTDTAIYDAWGNTVNRTGMSSATFLWDGQWGYYSDADTSVFWIRARAYAPLIARWTAVDPLFMTYQTGAYIYAVNSPVRVLDPAGLLPTPAGPLTPECCECNMANAAAVEDNLLTVWVPATNPKNPNVKCDIDIECAPAPKGCGGPVGCGRTYKRAVWPQGGFRVKVCISCECRPAWIVLTHELVHARESCETGTFYGPTCADCIRGETDAATAHCNEVQRTQPNLDVQKCITCSVRLSCNPACFNAPAPVCTCAEIGLTNAPPDVTCDPSRIPKPKR